LRREKERFALYLIADFSFNGACRNPRASITTGQYGTLTGNVGYAQLPAIARRCAIFEAAKKTTTGKQLFRDAATAG
jgi:hypothetical protein